MSTISSAKLAANRANSQKSTGPKTDTGKAASSANARTHGLHAKENVILPHQTQEFAELQSGLRQELNPQGTLQHILFESILHAAWNTRRARLLLAQLQSAQPDPDTDLFLNEDIEARAHRLDLYRRRAESSFNRGVKELRALQTEAAFRDANPEAAEIAEATDASVLVNTQTILRLQRRSPNPPANPGPQAPENSKPRAPRKPIDLPPFVADHIVRYKASLGTIAPASTKR